MTEVLVFSQQLNNCINSFVLSSKQVLRSQRSKRSRPCWMHLKVIQQGSPKVNFSCFVKLTYLFCHYYMLEIQDIVWRLKSWVVSCVVAVHLFTSTCLTMFVLCFIITSLPWNSISFTASFGTQNSFTSSPKNFQVPTFFWTFRTSASQGHLNFTSPPWRPSA